MSNWIPERALGYTQADYQVMPTSQFLSLLFRDIALRVGILLCYIGMAAWIFAVGTIVLAILYATYQVSGITGAIVVFMIMLTGYLSTK